MSPKIAPKDIKSHITHHLSFPDSGIQDAVDLLGVGVRKAVEDERFSTIRFYNNVREDNPVNEPDAGNAGAGNGYPGPPNHKSLAVVQMIRVYHYGDREQGIARCQAAGSKGIRHGGRSMRSGR